MTMLYWAARKLRNLIGCRITVRGNPSGSRFSLAEKLSGPSPAIIPIIALPILPILPTMSTMSTRSAWRALHYSAKRRAFQPATPYRCFSCTRAAQDQSKQDQERMTHFGFTNVPESSKESRGRLYTSPIE